MKILEKLFLLKEMKFLLIEKTIIEEEHIAMIDDAGVKTVILHKENINSADFAIIYNTLQKDTSNSEKSNDGTYIGS